MANIMLFKDETSVTQTKDIGRSKQFVLTSKKNCIFIKMYSNGKY